MRKYQIYVILILMAVLMTGCAGRFVDNAHRSLSVSKETYNANLTIAGELYRTGKISVLDRDRIIERGTDYMVTHNEAVTALLEYELSKEKEPKERYLALAANVLARLTVMIDYIKQVRGEK